MTNQLPAASIGAASTGDWLTATNLVLIAVGAILALLVIVWGAKLKRQRKAVDTAMEDKAETRGDETHPVALTAGAFDDGPPPAPETEPMPVAPSPPPLADTPVVAAAPFDPAPATLAADLATPPAETPAAPASADDLTALKGVGPKLAARLRDLGVSSFAQVAALSPTDAAALDAQLGAFQGRMARDRWVEQAGYLAKNDRAGFEAAFGKL